MLEKQAYIGKFGRLDIANGRDLTVHIFGTEYGVDTYRATVGMRRPLYRKWILWKIEPGLEWTEVNDYKTAYRITVGVDMLFWGPGKRE